MTQILSVLQRVALMMDDREVEASLLLVTGSITTEPEMVEVVTRNATGKATASEHESDENVAMTQYDEPGTAYAARRVYADQ